MWFHVNAACNAMKPALVQSSPSSALLKKGRPELPAKYAMWTICASTNGDCFSKDFEVVCSYICWLYMRSLFLSGVWCLGLQLIRGKRLYVHLCQLKTVNTEIQDEGNIECHIRHNIRLNIQTYWIFTQAYQVVVQCWANIKFICFLCVAVCVIFMV